MDSKACTKELFLKSFGNDDFDLCNTCSYLTYSASTGIATCSKYNSDNIETDEKDD